LPARDDISKVFKIQTWTVSSRSMHSIGGDFSPESDAETNPPAFASHYSLRNQQSGGRRWQMVGGTKLTHDVREGNGSAGLHRQQSRSGAGGLSPRTDARDEKKKSEACTALPVVSLWEVSPSVTREAGPAPGTSTMALDAVRPVVWRFRFIPVEH
jgi:hypothetical protein